MIYASPSARFECAHQREGTRDTRHVAGAGGCEASHVVVIDKAAEQVHIGVLEHGPSASHSRARQPLSDEQLCYQPKVGRYTHDVLIGVEQSAAYWRRAAEGLRQQVVEREIEDAACQIRVSGGISGKLRGLPSKLGMESSRRLQRTEHTRWWQGAGVRCAPSTRAPLAGSRVYDAWKLRLVEVTSPRISTPADAAHSAK